MLHKDDGKKYFILIKQYRIPIRRWILEFLAGMSFLLRRLPGPWKTRAPLWPHHLDIWSFPFLIISWNSGLIDSTDESIESAGIRELREETGYTATKVLRCTQREQFLNPGFSSDSSAFLLVECDGSIPENQNPKQLLESDESIEVVLVEDGKLLEYLDDVTQRGELEVASQVYSFALSRLFWCRFNLQWIQNKLSFYKQNTK